MKAMLYVPGNVEKMVRKMPTLDPAPDAVCLDCEDAIAMNQKEAVRGSITSLLQEVDVRVSSPSFCAAWFLPSFLPSFHPSILPSFLRALRSSSAAAAAAAAAAAKG